MAGGGTRTAGVSSRVAGTWRVVFEAKTMEGGEPIGGRYGARLCRNSRSSDPPGPGCTDPARVCSRSRLSRTGAAAIPGCARSTGIAQPHPASGEPRPARRRAGAAGSVAPGPEQRRGETQLNGIAAEPGPNGSRLIVPIRGSALSSNGLYRREGDLAVDLLAADGGAVAGEDDAAEGIAAGGGVALAGERVRGGTGGVRGGRDGAEGPVAAGGEVRAERNDEAATSPL